MTAAAVALALLAAGLHAYIWYLESFAWTGRARAVFGTTAQEAQATREMAFNQGFYNLFLGVIAAAGALLLARGHDDTGAALVVAGCGSMLAAALVLALTSPDKRRPAAIQGSLPLLALVALALA